jgi:hypothetical protein
MAVPALPHPSRSLQASQAISAAASQLDHHHRLSLQANQVYQPGDRSSLMLGWLLLKM